MGRWINVQNNDSTYWPWWHQQMETFSTLLALCGGNSPVTGGFPSQRPVMRSFDVFLDLRLNKRLSKQSGGWWFEMPSCSLWHHQNSNDKNDHAMMRLLCVHYPWPLMWNNVDGSPSAHGTSMFNSEMATILQIQFSNSLYRIEAGTLTLKLFSGKCNRPVLMWNQHWFRWWLGAARQQAIAWASDDPDLCPYMASLE